MSNEGALRHVIELIQYLKKQDNATLCDKILLKKLQSQTKKEIFINKKSH